MRNCAIAHVQRKRVEQLWMNVGGLSEHIVCSTSLGSPMARARPVLGQHQQDGDFGHGDVFDDDLGQHHKDGDFGHGDVFDDVFDQDDESL